MKLTELIEFNRSSFDCVIPKRSKTRAAHFAILRDERTGMYRATLGKSGSEKASQLGTDHKL